MRDPPPCDFARFRVVVNENVVHTLLVRGDAGRAAATEGVEHRAAGRRDEAYQPTHERKGLDRRVAIAPARDRVTLFVKVRGGIQPAALAARYEPDQPRLSLGT